MTDVTEPREPSDCSVRRTGRGSIVFAVLAVYVLSPVPLGWCLHKTCMFEIASPVFSAVYAPLEYLYEHIQFVKHFYDWQERFFQL